MKVQNTFTFIISKNFGHPISWSMPAWRVYLASGLAAVVLGAILISTVLFVSSYPRLLRIEKERDHLRQQRDALQEQILSANQEAFDLKEMALVALGNKGAPFPERDRSMAPDSGGEDYTPPVRINAVTSKIDPRAVEVVFHIIKPNEGATGRGGFLFAIFENEDFKPVLFSPSPSVGLNADGFPQSYKSGIRFSRVSNDVTYRRRIRRENPEEYFTHVTLYLFSLRGGLLVKDRFALDRDMFRQNAPVVKTLEIVQT